MASNVDNALLWRLVACLAVFLTLGTGCLYVLQQRNAATLTESAMYMVANETLHQLEAPLAAGDAAALRARLEQRLQSPLISQLQARDAAGRVLHTVGEPPADGAVRQTHPIFDSKETRLGEVVFHFDLSAFEQSQLRLLLLFVLSDIAILVVAYFALRWLLQRRAQTLTQLQEREERYRLALEAANDGIWEYNVADGAFLCSDRAWELLGEPSPAANGETTQVGVEQAEDAERVWRTLFERAHLEDREKLNRARSLLTSGLRETLTVRIRVRHGDAGERHLLTRTKIVLKDAAGRPVRVVGAISDVTQLVETEEALALLNRELEERVVERTATLETQALELAEANVRLKELDELKSNFLSSVSHELRTPLTSILGFARLIQKDFEANFKETDGPGAQRAAQRIRDNLRVISVQGQRLSRLVNGVLDLDKIESGKLDWRDELVDPGPVLERAMEAATPLFVEKPTVIFVPQLRLGLPKIFMDPDRLEQIVLNLLHNAVKFTDTGHVTLSAQRNDRGDLHVCVEDSGPGVPPTSQEEIFGKFMQLEPHGDVHMTRGAGLGLAICREIVLHYGGHIWVDSVDGHGSAFSFTIPHASEQAAPHAVASHG